MLFVLFFYAFPFLTTSSAAPVERLSSPAYVPGPSGRGTVSLVTNCVITLSLCVSTAIHLNVFPHGTSLQKRVLAQFCWALLGMFAPEVVLWRAITQWRVARSLCRKRNELLDDEKRLYSGELAIDKGAWRPHRIFKPWGLEHGFLLVMGGMGVTLAEDDDTPLFKDGNTLTPYGALTLAKAGALPGFEREKVAARSKADNIGKTLVCVQAVWMVIQTIARKIAGLPITLLELNTLAHVACALLMYLIWWRKPQNVNDVLEIPISKDLAYFMNPAPKKSSWKPSHEWKVRALDDPRYRPGHDPRDVVGSHQVVGQINSEWQALTPERKKEIETRVWKEDGVVMVYPGEGLHGNGWYLGGLNPIHLTAADVQKMQAQTQTALAHNAIAKFSKNLDKAWQGKGLIREASNFWISGGWETFSAETLILFSVLGFIYGGIHGSSWNAHFPSLVEQHMWRVSVCSVAIGGFVISGLIFLIGILKTMTERPVTDSKSWITEKIQYGFGTCCELETCGIFFPFLLFAVIILVLFLSLLLISGAISLVGISIAYLFSRAFIVVESFISIRSLPIGAYDTVKWVDCLPHIA